MICHPYQDTLLVVICVVLNVNVIYKSSFLPRGTEPGPALCSGSILSDHFKMYPCNI